MEKKKCPACGSEKIGDSGKWCKSCEDVIMSYLEDWRKRCQKS